MNNSSVVMANHTSSNRAEMRKGSNDVLVGLDASNVSIEWRWQVSDETKNIDFYFYL